MHGTPFGFTCITPPRLEKFPYKIKVGDAVHFENQITSDHSNEIKLNQGWLQSAIRVKKIVANHRSIVPTMERMKTKAEL